MTTAHKPTWHPAVGTANQGGYRYHAQRVQYSSRDMASHTKLKVRQVGQNAPEEMEGRDIQSELESRELKHQDKVKDDKRKVGLMPYAEESEGREVEAIEGARVEGEEEPPAPVDPVKAIAAVNWDKIDDADDSDSENEDQDKSENEDEEAELLKELEKIKKNENKKERKKNRKKKQQLIKQTRKKWHVEILY